MIISALIFFEANFHQKIIDFIKKQILNVSSSNSAFFRGIVSRTALITEQNYQFAKTKRKFILGVLAVFFYNSDFIPSTLFNLSRRIILDRRRLPFFMASDVNGKSRKHNF